MLTEPPAIPIQPVAPNHEAVERALRAQGEAKYFDDLVAFGWSSIGRGIILAGGCYPTAIFVSYLVLGLLLMAFSPSSAPNLSPWNLGGAIAAGLVLSILAGAVALAWCSLVTVITLPVVHLIVWSLKIKLNWIRMGAFCGGLVAFLATFPVAVHVPRTFQISSVAAGLFTAWIGPGLATIVGQIGGARGGSNAAWRLSAKMASRRSLRKLGWSRFPTPETSDSGELRAEDDRPQFQFRTVHLLWVGVWLSLLLTVIRLSGIPYGLLIPVVLAWLVYQAGTLVMGRWLAQRLGPWWRGERQSRST